MRDSTGITLREFLAAMVILVSAKFAVILCQPDALPAWGDAATYVRMARNAEFAFDRPSGYAIFLRACFAVFGQDSVTQIAWVQHLLSTMTALIVYAAARQYLRVAAVPAVLAGLAYCISPLNCLMERALLAETLAALLLAIHLVLIFRYLHQPARATAACIGATAAALPLLRSVFSFAGPLAYAVIAVGDLGVHRSKSAAILPRMVYFLAAWASIILPYGALYSAQYCGDWKCTPFSTTTTGGWILWNRVLPLAQPDDLQLLPWGDTLYRTIAPHRDRPFFELVASPESPTRNFLECYGLGGQGNVEADRILSISARTVIAHHPVGFAKIVLASAWTYAVTPTQGYMEWFGPATTGHEIWTAPRPLIALLALLSVAALARKRSPESACAATLGMMLLTYVFFAATASEFVERYYQPLELPAVLLLAWAAQALINLGRPHASNAKPS